MAFQVERSANTTTVQLVLRGDLDLYSAPALDDALVEAEGEKWPVTFIDLRALDFVDSAGLRLIVRAHARAQQDGRRVVLIRGPKTVQRVFASTGLDAELEFVDEAPEAASPTA